MRNNNIYDVIEGHADDDDHPGDRGIRGALVDSAYMRQKNRDMTAVKKAYLKYMRMMKEYESKYDQDDPELARFRQEILGNTLFSSTPSDYIYELQAPRLVEEIKRSSSSHAIRVSEPNPSGSTHRPVVTQQKTSGHRDRYPKSQGTYVSFERYGNRKPEELENAILGTFETAAIRRKRRQRKEKDTTSVDSSSQRVRFLTKTKTAGEGGSEYDDQQTAFSTDGSTFVIDGKEEEDSDSGSSRPLDVFDLTGGVTRVKQPYEQILTPNYYDGQTGEYV